VKNRFILAFTLVAGANLVMAAEPLDGLKYREIGPFRGGDARRAWPM